MSKLAKAKKSPFQNITSSAGVAHFYLRPVKPLIKKYLVNKDDGHRQGGNIADEKTPKAGPVELGCVLCNFLFGLLVDASSDFQKYNNSTPTTKVYPFPVSSRPIRAARCQRSVDTSTARDAVRRPDPPPRPRWKKKRSPTVPLFNRHLEGHQRPTAMTTTALVLACGSNSPVGPRKKRQDHPLCASFHCGA